ncbi:RHS domain-containing protein [Neisseria sp. DTU_2021_1001991_1_SI_NGA_ILE_055]|uniref:RHS domain-containing protein n=1 Tax=Neisseria sp. DTU_2021_1001991_1_SI_NGA_ILE_055 TaxID=3077590 RepID=UPI0028E76B56|nr:RHS domain-containing protein [Neisseria sp. DTU_2021_1001991_1_SI_NGA_ILE_055]WNS84137.1 RHS domain-containing protein [Neisseria sp. DTU_2021_1001991_1_SI_NGA_ILE_055]
MIIDHLGTPIAAHNVKGEAVWTAEYEAWGRICNENRFRRPQSPHSVQYHGEKNRLHYNRFITTKRTLDKIKRTRDLTTRNLLRKSWSI